MAEFFFPTHGVTIEAETQEEALKKLEKTSKDSTSSNTPAWTSSKKSDTTSK